MVALESDSQSLFFDCLTESSAISFPSFETRNSFVPFPESFIVQNASANDDSTSPLLSTMAGDSKLPRQESAGAGSCVTAGLEQEFRVLEHKMAIKKSQKCSIGQVRRVFKFDTIPIGSK